MNGNQEAARRLGKRELGPHAFEECMPDRIASLIASESATNKSYGVIPALAALLECDSNSHAAYLCHESAVQISKLCGEGSHFCAYRNIQMMLAEPHPIYSIPELQDKIEKAWDEGFNPHGRVETGGIKGTRKHIGTSEAQALFQSLKLPCKAAVILGPDAWQQLLDSIEIYFTTDLSKSKRGRIHMTARAPIFLQRPSHSLSVIGIEWDRKGKRRLLVFDPGYQISSMITPSSPSEMSALRRRLVLSRYRREEQYLQKYRNFETLSLSAANFLVRLNQHEV